MDAVATGSGVTARTRFGLRHDPPAPPAAEYGLPALPKLGLVLHGLEEEPDQTSALLLPTCGKAFSHDHARPMLTHNDVEFLRDSGA